MRANTLRSGEHSVPAAGRHYTFTTVRANRGIQGHDRTLGATKNLSHTTANFIILCYKEFLHFMNHPIDLDSLDSGPISGETSKAYSAFCCYRDMGPGRSVDKACKLFYANKGIDRGSARRYGGWSLWCGKFDWVERAREYDHMVAEERRRELAENRRKRWHEHLDFVAEIQTPIHQLIRGLITNLAKLQVAPSTEITQVKFDNATNTKTTVKTNIGELFKALNDTLSRENLSYNVKDEPEIEERVIKRVVWAKSERQPLQAPEVHTKKVQPITNSDRSQPEAEIDKAA